LDGNVTESEDQRMLTKILLFTLECRLFAVTTNLCGNIDSVGAFNPLFYRRNKIIAACGIFNCTEFGIIKIRIEQKLPFSNVFNRDFQNGPFDNDMFLHLACSHIYKRYNQNFQSE